MFTYDRKINQRIPENISIQNLLQVWSINNFPSLLQEVLKFFNETEFKLDSNSKEYANANNKMNEIKANINKSMDEIKKQTNLNINIYKTTELFFSEIRKLFDACNDQLKEKRKEYHQLSISQNPSNLSVAFFFSMCALVLYDFIYHLDKVWGENNNIDESTCTRCNNLHPALLGLEITRIVAAYGLKHIFDQITRYHVKVSRIPIVFNHNLNIYINSVKDNIAHGYFVGKTKYLIEKLEVPKSNNNKLEKRKSTIINNFPNNLSSTAITIHTPTKDIYSKRAPISESQFRETYYKNSLCNTHLTNENLGIKIPQKKDEISLPDSSTKKNKNALEQGDIIVSKTEANVFYIQTSKSGFFTKYNAEKLPEMLHGVSSNLPLDKKKFNNVIREGDLYDNNRPGCKGMVPAGHHKAYKECKYKVKADTDVRIRVAEQPASAVEKKLDPRISTILVPIDAIPHPKSHRN